MTQRHRFASLLAVILVAIAIAAVGCGQKKAQVSAANQEKIAALDAALKSGALTQAEYAAKVKAINDPASASSQPVSDSATAAPASDPSAQAAQPSQDAASAQSAATTANSPNTAAMDSPAPSGAGNLYNDPHGSFSVMIPEGWSAAAQGPDGTHGVQMSQGKSWAVVAPFNKVSSPGDVVNSLAGQIQPQYQNFAMGQHGTTKFNGLDAAVATFSGTNSKGMPVTVVIMGVAAPGGRFFAVMSSVPQGQEQQVNPALAGMVQSIRFGG